MGTQARRGRGAGPPRDGQDGDGLWAAWSAGRAGRSEAADADTSTSRSSSPDSALAAIARAPAVAFPNPGEPPHLQRASLSELPPEDLVRLVQYYRRMRPTHEMHWNAARRRRPWEQQQGDPRRWDAASMVVFLCEAFGPAGSAIAAQDPLAVPPVPPDFDATEGRNTHRRMAAGLINAIVNHDPFKDYLRFNGVNSCVEPGRHLRQTLLGFLVLADQFGSISAWMNARDSPFHARRAWTAGASVSPYVAERLLRMADVGELAPDQRRPPRGGGAGRPPAAPIPAAR